MKIENPDRIGENIKKSKRLQRLREYSLGIAQLKLVKAGNCCGDSGDGSPPPAQTTTAYTKPKTIVGG